MSVNIIGCVVKQAVFQNKYFKFLFTWEQKHYIEDGSGDASERSAVVGECEATIKKNSKHEKHPRTDRRNAENIRNVQVYIFFQELKHGLLLTLLSFTA